jgi:hypothetical protein
MSGIVGRRMPHREGSRLAPPLWASEDGLHELFAHRGIDLTIQRHTLHWRFTDPREAAAFALEKVAGMRTARRALGEEAIEAIRADLVALYEERMTPEGIPYDYLLVRGTKVGA